MFIDDRSGGISHLQFVLIKGKTDVIDDRSGGKSHLQLVLTKGNTDVIEDQDRRSAIE